MQPKEEVEVEEEDEDEDENEEEEEEGEDRLKDSRRAIHEPSWIERERKYIEDASGIAVSEAGPVEEGVLLARVHVPELYVSKCLQFPKDQLVWDVKQQCLASLPKFLLSIPPRP
ncbi:hypothetical protein M0802_001879 [Mischocyttarus mexicanus]|nr:hypothetical protein M0802_001879 [Mischocyttarus mexicanus]